jgi:hypothetical protein
MVSAKKRDSNTARQRIIRAEQSNEQRSARVALQATNEADRRQKQTDEQRRARLALQATRTAAHKTIQTVEQRNRRLAIDAMQHALNRDEETEEQRQQRLAVEAARSAANRDEETEEQRRLRLAYNATRIAANRDEETEEQRQQRLAVEATRSASYRERMRQIRAVVATLQDDQVPDIARHVETEESHKNAYYHLLKTQIGDDEAIPKHFDKSNINYPLVGLGLHQANVCVACDRFITGIVEIKWVAEDHLLLHKRRLSDIQISDPLKNCYKVLDSDLHSVLLSPRARVNVNNYYMCCSHCFSALKNNRVNKPPPKFAIANKWAIGTLPTELEHYIIEVTGPLIATVRPYAYVMHYTGGIHKCISGSFTFFTQDVAQNIAALNHHVDLTGDPGVYVVLSGRFTRSQRNIIRNRCLLEVESFNRIYEWLRKNNPKYAHKPQWSECPKPVFFDNNEGVNNTDEEGNPQIEKTMDFQYFFPSNGEPTERTATFNSDEEFLKAYFADRQPSMIFTSKNSLRDYELSLADVFPLYFPFGTGSIRGEKRTNAVSDIECLRHYLRLSLPQFQKADFILVVSQMLFRAEAFRSASVRCMSKTVTDGQNLGEKFSMITDSQIINISHLEHLQSSKN